jgi:plasmid stabilization system protein ParE
LLPFSPIKRGASQWFRGSFNGDGTNLSANNLKRAGEAMEVATPRGEKSKYTDKQERKADHIAEGYEKKGVSEKEAERRAWATVNKDDGGGKRSGSGRGVRTGNPAAHKGGKTGGTSSAARPPAARSASAKKAAATRKRNVEHAHS